MPIRAAERQLAQFQLGIPCRLIDLSFYAPPISPIEFYMRRNHSRWNRADQHQLLARRLKNASRFRHLHSDFNRCDHVSLSLTMQIDGVLLAQGFYLSPRTPVT